MCLTAPIFRSARACGHQALARTPSQGTTHHTDDLAGSLGLSCVRGASVEETLGENSPLATSMPATPGTEVQAEDHRNALDRKVLQKTPVLAMAQAQTCHRSRKCTKIASEPRNRRPFALSSAKSHTQSESREFVGKQPEQSVRPTIPFPFGLVSAVPRAMIFHLNLRPNSGHKWSTN